MAIFPGSPAKLGFCDVAFLQHHTPNDWKIRWNCLISSPKYDCEWNISHARNNYGYDDWNCALRMLISLQMIRRWLTIYWQITCINRPVGWALMRSFLERVVRDLNPRVGHIANRFANGSPFQRHLPERRCVACKRNAGEMGPANSLLWQNVSRSKRMCHRCPLM